MNYKSEVSTTVTRNIPDFDRKTNNIYESLVVISKRANQIASEMKAAGGTVKTTVVRNDCYAVAVMGYCAVEFDQTFTSGGQTMGPMKFRGTTVARKVDGAWKWEHWHGSFRELPTVQTTTTTTPSAPAPAPAPNK